MTKARDLANGGFGLVLIKPSSVVNGTDNGKGTISFNNTYVQLNGIFTSTYDNYKLELSMPTASAAGSVAFQFCTSGSANTTSNYNNASWAFRSGNAQLVDTANENSSYAAVLSGVGNGCTVSMDIFNPFSSSETNTHGTGDWVSGSAGYKIFTIVHGSRFASSTSFDGIKINFGSNNQAGTVSVYGYVK